MKDIKMALRKINSNEQIPNLQDFPAARKWESMTCKLVTPMYGGGVESAVPDIQFPIRVAAIRGQLRFWWRILAEYKWKLSNIQKQEFALWGGIADGEDAGQSSLVFLRVRNVKFDDKDKWTEDTATALYTEFETGQLGYALFPARPERRKQPSIKLLRPEFSWHLEWYLDKNAQKYHFEKNPETQKWEKVDFKKDLYQNDFNQVAETLRWWANFGGLGARTRRGCGAFEVIDSSIDKIKDPLTADDVKSAGCQLAQTNSQTDALKAWEVAVKHLRDFRQEKGIGRNYPSKTAQIANKPAGRSRWSEPDAIRRITRQYPAQHKPIHPAGNQFPRGLFGMPIIFHFVGGGEPKDTSLQPVGKERMSSPIIVRPMKTNNSWVAGALLLPHKHLLNMEVELKGVQKVTLLDENKVNEIKPIKANGGNNPLTAFIAYFAKPTTQKGEDIE